ncbi:MAG: hypothetical protein WBA22_01170, partial [Candidatus Methanofastidiosia archaeon]
PANRMAATIKSTNTLFISFTSFVIEVGLKKVCVVNYETILHAESRYSISFGRKQGSNPSRPHIS